MMPRRITGRRWHRAQTSCPWWCAQGHECTLHGPYPLPGGEHSSKPGVRTLTWGKLVATRTQKANGVGYLAVRTTIRLPRDEQAAHWAAETLATAIDAAIRRVLAEATGPAGDVVDGELLEPLRLGAAR